MLMMSYFDCQPYIEIALSWLCATFISDCHMEEIDRCSDQVGVIDGDGASNFLLDGAKLLT